MKIALLGVLLTVIGILLASVSVAIGVDLLRETVFGPRIPAIGGVGQYLLLTTGIWLIGDAITLSIRLREGLND